MDRLCLAAEILRDFNNETEWDERAKIGSIALVLMALEIDPTEAQWRDYLLIAGVNIYDADSQKSCIDASVFYHYSGLLRLSELEDGSWINENHPNAFRGVTDLEFASKVSMLRDQARELRETLKGVWND